MLYGSPCCSGVEWDRGVGRARTNNRFPCLLSPWVGSGEISFLIWGAGWRGCPEVQSQGGLSGSPLPPASGVECRGHAQLPVFAPDSPEVAVGVCFVSVSFGPEFPPAAHARSIFSPMSFLCILLLEERCVQVQAVCKGSQVPAPSLSQKVGYFTCGIKALTSILLAKLRREEEISRVHLKPSTP